jgi:hypothetical protein
MATFKLGDRVARQERPDDCGVIVAVLDQGAAGVLYRIDWDTAPSVLLSESALVPCRSSTLPRLE